MSCTVWLAVISGYLSPACCRAHAHRWETGGREHRFIRSLVGLQTVEDRLVLVCQLLCSEVRADHDLAEQLLELELDFATVETGQIVSRRGSASATLLRIGTEPPAAASTSWSTVPTWAMERNASHSTPRSTAPLVTAQVRALEI